LEGLPQSILSKLEVVEHFSFEFLGKSVYDFKLNSLGSLAAQCLYQKHPEFFIKLDEDKRLFIQRAFFGGHCELYTPGSHYDVFSFDFPAMYGHLLLGGFPSSFE
jgi:hypothetical protein